MDWYLMMLCIFHFQIQLVHNESHWIPPCRARTGLQASAVARADRQRSETPASPFAGVTVVVEATVFIPAVIPAQAGIQCLCFANNNRITA